MVTRLEEDQIRIIVRKLHVVWVWMVIRVVEDQMIEVDDIRKVSSNEDQNIRVDNGLRNGEFIVIKVLSTNGDGCKDRQRPNQNIEICNGLRNENQVVRRDLDSYKSSYILGRRNDRWIVCYMTGIEMKWLLRY